MKEIGQSIWRLEAPRPGSHLMITGGIHGNEQTGIQVVRDLVERFTQEPRQLGVGTLTLALGNLKAIEMGKRSTGPGLDMNRIFVEERLRDPKTYEEERAAVLAPFMKEADVLVDIHSTNKPSRPFAVAKTGDSKRLELARFFPAEDYLISPTEIIGGTTDVWMTEHGGIGFGYESGQAGDVTKVAEVLASLDRVMVHMGMVEKALPEYSAGELRVVELKRAVVMTEAGFRFAEGRGEGSFEPFKEGDVLGFAGDDPVTAPFDGLLMFPKPKELHHPGQPVAFLAVQK